MSRLLRIAPLLLTAACAHSQAAAPQAAPSSVTESTAPAPDTLTTVTLASEVEWEPLNPIDGFESPPHIHNVTYRGVVIRGRIHNDDPSASTLWMPPGSFWTQPKGESHITSATGSDTLAYIEIDQGPYLVHPADQATDGPEKPVNVHASNIVWVHAESPFGPRPADPGAQVAFLWGDLLDAQPSGSMVKLPAGSSATLQGFGDSIRAVVVQGQPGHSGVDGADTVPLTPGSTFSAEGPSQHALQCPQPQDCVLYVRARGRIEVEG